MVELKVLERCRQGQIKKQCWAKERAVGTSRRTWPECFLGEGGFGRVYKGQLPNGQVVAVKLNLSLPEVPNREFLVEVLMLSLLHHPNLMNLIGYCADGDQRLLVYEFMPLGSLEDHLLGFEFFEFWKGVLQV
ncbi:unnamed protein product [Fraxinus pennsylvanica]|uniref:Protein kinase domain-containing protein n=1 Tax=Fraxinus pennsylvanica TaxID=56036 RepID=A0AAD2AEF4_9LAMI|nr:unnamed protein product [Fraxinus pennsylvanica]